MFYASVPAASQMYLKLRPQCEGSKSNSHLRGAFHVSAMQLLSLDISSESSHPGSHLKSLEKILLKRVPEIFTLFLKSNICPKFKLKFWKFHIFPYFLPDKNIIGKVRENSNCLNLVVSISIAYIQMGQKLD